MRCGCTCVSLVLNFSASTQHTSAQNPSLGLKPAMQMGDKLEGEILNEMKGRTCGAQSGLMGVKGR